VRVCVRACVQSRRAANTIQTKREKGVIRSAANRLGVSWVSEWLSSRWGSLAPKKCKVCVCVVRVHAGARARGIEISLESRSALFVPMAAGQIGLGRQI